MVTGTQKQMGALQNRMWDSEMAPRIFIRGKRGTDHCGVDQFIEFTTEKEVNGLQVGAAATGIGSNHLGIKT